MEAGHTEIEYYAYAKIVAQKRNFNIRTAHILRFYQFNVLEFLLEATNPDYPEDFHSWQAADQFAWLCNDCKCPITIMRAYLASWQYDVMDTCKEKVIAENLRKFPAKSFFRFGDRNAIDEKQLANYTADCGLPIDVQAMEISHIMPISEQDIVDFVYAYPKGVHSYKFLSSANRLENAFYQLTGMRLTHEYASQLIRMLDKREPINFDDVPF